MADLITNIRQINRKTKNKFNYVYTGASRRHERPKDSQAIEAYMAFGAEQKGLVSRASKGRKSIPRKMGRANVW